MMVRWAFAVMAVVGAGLAVAGCGSDGGGSSERATRSSDASAEVEAKLDVVIEEVGGKSGVGIELPPGMMCTKSIPATCRAAVECPAKAGDDAGAKACEWLARDGREALAAEPAPDEACTMQYGGPEVATVTGTLGGDEIDATFTREHGCAIARFDAVAPLWGGGGDGDAAPPAQPEVVDDPPEAFS